LLLSPNTESGAKNARTRIRTLFIMGTLPKNFSK
jgi:hypothetical protein